MKPTHRHCRGFSLIEMLVVMVIVTILAVLGVTMLGNRPSASVRVLMDELEGVISAAHQRTVATGQDVIISTTGEWALTNLIQVSFTGAAGSDIWQPAHRVAGGVPTAFLREHLHAGIVTATNAGWWAAATGGNTNLSSVAPFNDVSSGFNGILADNTLNLFQGASGTGTARISGANKRFTTTFWIEVVGLREGTPLPGGPRGVIVVQANGATIYRFYNPGTLGGGDGNWRRI
jgi:prepilin-type N-terminal cleavage/methylation domain-containing protein